LKATGKVSEANASKADRSSAKRRSKNYGQGEEPEVFGVLVG